MIGFESRTKGYGRKTESLVAVLIETFKYKFVGLHSGGQIGGIGQIKRTHGFACGVAESARIGSLGCGERTWRFEYFFVVS